HVPVRVGEREGPVDVHRTFRPPVGVHVQPLVGAPGELDVPGEKDAPLHGSIHSLHVLGLWQMLERAASQTARRCAISCCMRTRRAKTPFLARSSSWVPISTSLPSSRTRM